MKTKTVTVSLTALVALAMGFGAYFTMPDGWVLHKSKKHKYQGTAKCRVCVDVSGYGCSAENEQIYPGATCDNNVAEGTIIKKCDGQLGATLHNSDDFDNPETYSRRCEIEFYESKNQEWVRIYPSEEYKQNHSCGTFTICASSPAPCKVQPE